MLIIIFLSSFEEEFAIDLKYALELMSKDRMNG